MAYANGQFPTSATTALATAPGQRLEATAARQWDALARSVQNTYGWLPVLTDSYRPLSVQRRIFFQRYDNTYRSGQTRKFYEGRYWWKKPGYAAAATPGTSNHGWAKAVDVSGLGGFSGSRFKQLASLAPRFGFTNTEGRSVGEAWHWVFTGSYQVSRPIGGTGAVSTPNIPGAPTPIPPKGFLMALSDEQQENLYALVQNIAGWTYLGGKGVNAGDAAGGTIAQRVINLDRQLTGAQGNATNAVDALGVLLARTAPVARKDGPVEVRQEIADAKTIVTEVKALLAAQGELIRQLSTAPSGTPVQIDYDRIDQIARSAVAEGLDVNLTITTPGNKEEN